MKRGVSTWCISVTSSHTEIYITIKGSFVLGERKTKATSLPDALIRIQLNVHIEQRQRSKKNFTFDQF